MMTKLLQSRVLWGSLLILGGVLFLLQNLFNIAFGGLFWALIFGLAGVFFLAVFLGNRLQWWSVIPGFSLLGIALLIALDFLFPNWGSQFGGSIFLGGIGLSFLVVYLVNRDNWWAIIPMGVLFTLALVAGLGGSGGAWEGALFFLGIGLTFVGVALAPTPQGSMKWAWIPAAILIAMGLLVLSFTEALIAYIWPVALILVGIFFIVRTFSSR